MDSPSEIITPQEGRLPWSYGIEYDQAVFIVDSRNENKVSLWGNRPIVLHVNTQSTERPYLDWGSFNGYGSLERVGEYVESMSF